jgi:GTP-binding protein YchF
VYSDLETLEKQADKRRKAARADKTLADEVAAMDAALELLQAGTPIYRSQLDEAQRQLLKPFFLLTAKPAMALVNLDEAQLVDPEPLLAPVREAFGPGGDERVIGLCIQLEAEAAMLDEESRSEMLEALGLGEGALPAFLHAAYQMLGLRTFFTTGEKETRAWTFRTGSKAPQCAGVIHTDFERGFIRAETIHWDELLELGSWAKAREVGKARIEGKEYVVADGDVMDFRFNV